MLLSQVITKIVGQMCFMTDEDIAELRANVPGADLPVLVRCGAQRFVCRLPELEYKIRHEVEAKDDYVRDVSVPHPAPPEWIRLGYKPPTF